MNIKASEAPNTSICPDITPPKVKKTRKAAAPKKSELSYPVRINIKSEQREYNDIFFPHIMSDSDEFEYYDYEFGDNNLFDFNTVGYIKDDGDSIEIQYSESDLTGLGRSFTKINISKEPSPKVIISRFGEFNTFLIFENGKRHNCAYQDTQSPYQLCVQTHNMKCKMSPTGGQLKLDYILEINGTTAERNRFTLTVEVDNADRSRRF